MKAFFLLYVLFGYLYLGANPAHAGGIYKWLDQHGVTHYSDQPSKQHHSVKLGRDDLPYLHINQPPPDIPRVKTTASRAKSRRVSMRRPEPDCDRFQTEIRKIEATLRQGYSEPAGSRLRERKREWTDRLHKQCY
jgi:hypothetical protein